MLYYFPDSQDYVDPSFDFDLEVRSSSRIPQRDDQYAHEVFKEPPYDGMLISRSIVDDRSSAKYTHSQRLRFHREGAKAYLRTSSSKSRELLLMGDCGAFQYVEQEYPPCSVDDVIGFYDVGRFDYGLSVDHVIREFQPSHDAMGWAPRSVKERQELTLNLASDFWKTHQTGGLRFHPVGVAQGWSPKSYASAVADLQRIGYDYVALGGMAFLRTSDILQVLEAVNEIRMTRTKLHLLGVSRIESTQTYGTRGVASIDSTYPLKTAFKDERENYLTPSGSYMAIKVPQADGNPSLKRLISSGKVSQQGARDLESLSLRSLKAYANGSGSIDAVLEALFAYERLYDPSANRIAEYRRVLEDRPWNTCPCEVCIEIGYHVILYRGTERNKRRAFHNLTVFYSQLRRARASSQ